MNKKIFILSIITLTLDQVIKSILSVSIKLGESIKVIEDFFYLTIHHNYGASWGILQDKTLLIIIGTLLALILIYRYMYSFVMNKRNLIAFGLIIGGILGNLIDRVLLGYVVDFFDFLIFGYNFPIFNIADIALVVGVGLLILAIIKGEDKIEKNNSRK